MSRWLVTHWRCTPAEAAAIAWCVRTFHARRTRRARELASQPPDAPLDIAEWLREIYRQEEVMRASTALYERFRNFARRLGAGAIRASSDAAAMMELEAALRDARYPGRFDQLNRVWTRSELGALITEATNRARQLAAGDPQREKGPALDPTRLPDDRLDWLIQRHRDLNVVAALQAERFRRQQQQLAA